MQMKFSIALCALIVTTQPVSAQYAEHRTIKPLLIQAINEGRAEGRLGGPAKQLIAREFGSSEPIIVTVKRIQMIEPLALGCARLEVLTQQAGVYDKNAHERAKQPVNASLTYRISYCRDGSMPEPIALKKKTLEPKEKAADADGHENAP